MKIVIIDQKSIMDLIQFEATQNTVAMEENLEHFENGRKFKNPEQRVKHFPLLDLDGEVCVGC